MVGALDGVDGVRGVLGVNDFAPTVHLCRGVMGIFLESASRCRGVLGVGSCASSRVGGATYFVKMDASITLGVDAVFVTCFVALKCRSSFAGDDTVVGLPRVALDEKTFSAAALGSLNGSSSTSSVTKSSSRASS